ncbi:Arm domain-containing protein/F-box-like domain-containing protein [Cephalotus follicularis]|uniref:Arm domain-containing protein/F-box-like domain-containing protein n=1 Tax=Cephalotus follicularis TaxID=3775 RepID=A0A1Q3CGU9_CEPFO|nr:Arm domain-containing protein/F-box-like domain-containing protein [Cephalotus follicularis]
MTRRVRRKGSLLVDERKQIGGRNSEILDGECLNSDRIQVDWTTLPDDTVIQLFSYLNYRDRASLSSTCRTFRHLGSSPCLWGKLDLRSYKFDTAGAVSLSSRATNLRKLRFRGAESADAIISLQARGLSEISGDFVRDITDATLSVIAARHEMLESLHLGPDACDRISSDAIRAVAFCCPNLSRLWLSGLREISADAINSLATHCRKLVDIGFIDSDVVDEEALGNLVSVQFLSVAGTRNLKWDDTAQVCSKLPGLVGLDVSRTDITLNAATMLLSSSHNLKALFALNCPVFEAEVNNNMRYNTKGKLLLATFSDIYKGVASLFAGSANIESDVFHYWRKLKKRDGVRDRIVSWIEWVLSHSLLRIAENNPKELDDFWLRQGTALLLSLMQSSQEEVQERAATAAATFVVIDDENATVDCRRAEAIMRDGGIRLLLDLARSCQEGIQSEAAKAIANLSVDSKVAKAVADIGGINILANLARSMNRLVAEEAAGGLWNLSVGEEHKGAIAEAGCIKALVDLIFKWSSSNDGVLERAAGALANLAADDKCGMEVAMAGGVRALVMLAQPCKFEGVQEQAARALANLAAHGDSNCNNAAVGQEAGALEALVQLTCSHHEGVKQEAAGALWNLSFDDKNREGIAAAGGVEALVSLAQTCSSSSQGLQERAAGALWGLSVSEANSVAIGQGGGVAPLIALARSDVADVHETAAGALWNLAFNPSNAIRIVEDGGVPTLVHLCSSSQSKMARFMAALALAYMFDRRMDEVASPGPSSEGTSKSLTLAGMKRVALKHIEEFVLSFSDPHTFGAAFVLSSPTALTQVAEAAHIPETGHLRCSQAEMGRFVTMLRNPSNILKACASFALLQFTFPGGRHAMHHTVLLQNLGAPRVLRPAAAAATAPIEAKIFAKIVLRNLEHHNIEAST